MKFWMNVWRPLLFDAIMYPVTLIITLTCLPALFSRRATRMVVDNYMRLVMWLVERVLGIRCNFAPAQPVANGRGRILAAKHQSAWETLALRYYYPNAIGVAKQVLFWLPIGWYMYRLGYVPIDRDGGGAALRKMMAQVKLRIDEGMDVVVYPEGTRRLVGAEPAYRTGVYGLYQYCDAEVLPIALDSGKTWGRKPLLRQSGVVHVQELPTLPKGMQKKEFMQVLQSRIEGAMQ